MNNNENNEVVENVKTEEKVESNKNIETPEEKVENNTNIEKQESPTNNDNKDFKKKRLIIVIIAVVVVLLIILLIIFGIKSNSNKNTNNESNKKIQDNTKEEDKKNKKEVYKKLEEWEEKEFKEQESHALVVKSDDQTSYNNPKMGLPIGACGKSSLPLEGKNFTLKDLSDANKLDILISFTPKNQINFGDNSLDVLAVFTEDYAKNFFADTSFLDTISNNEKYSGIYPYHLLKKDNKYYLMVYGFDCTVSDFDGSKIEFKEIKKDGKYIIKSFVVYYYYLENDEAGNIKEKYYKDEDKKELLLELGNNDNPSKFTEIMDKLDYYDFYYDTTGNNYRFEKAIFHKK